MYAAIGGPNVKWGAPISKGGPGITGPPASDGPVRKPRRPDNSQKLPFFTRTFVPIRLPRNPPLTPWLKSVVSRAEPRGSLQQRIFQSCRSQRNFQIWPKCEQFQKTCLIRLMESQTQFSCWQPKQWWLRNMFAPS